MGTTATSGFPRSPRTAVLASADAAFRKRVRDALADLRWQVREAEGGAETLACLDAAPAEAVVLDSWLPDLEIHEFVAEFKRVHPGVDLIMADASITAGTEYRGPRRNEVLHAFAGRRPPMAQSGALRREDALARTPKTTGAWAEAPAPLSPKRNSAPPTPSRPCEMPRPVRQPGISRRANGLFRNSSAPILPSSKSAGGFVWWRRGRRLC